MMTTMTPFDQYDQPATDPLDEEERWELIHVYDKKEAIVKGVLVPCRVKAHGKWVYSCFTDRLFERYGNDLKMLRCIVAEGLKRLGVPEASDDSSCRVRVIVPDEIMVIAYDDGLVFLEPCDS